MYDLFFKDLLSTLSTAVVIVVVLFIVIITVKSPSIKKWGRLTLILTFVGLFLCCLAVTRDNYVQALLEESGLFALNSLPINTAYIAGAINAYAVLSSMFVKDQKYRKVMFFLLSSSIISKIIVIEVSRIILL